MEFWNPDDVNELVWNTHVLYTVALFILKFLTSDLVMCTTAPLILRWISHCLFNPKEKFAWALEIKQNYLNCRDAINHRRKYLIIYEQNMRILGLFVILHFSRAVLRLTGPLS